jgi:hypothetical protein
LRHRLGQEEEEEEEEQEEEEEEEEAEKEEFRTDVTEHIPLASSTPQI